MAGAKGTSRGADDAAPPAVATTPPEPIAYTGLRGWLALTVAVVAIWWVVLIGMAIVSANPVTLNFAQVAQATHVVTGTVLDAETGRVRVDRDWKLRSPAEITVENLADVQVASANGLREGTAYLLPLVARDGGDRFVVVTARLPGFEEDERGEKIARFGPPVVYPATDEVLEQLQDVLAWRPRTDDAE